MPSYERGAYEPTDEVRVFDAAEEEEDEEGSRLPLLIVMALLVLAAFGSVVWLAYERGVASGRTEPRILTAEQGPAKVAPATPGGAETPYKGLKIYEQPAPSDEEADAQAASAPARITPMAAKPAAIATAAPALRAPPAEMMPAAKPTATPKPVKPVQTASAAPAAMSAAKPLAKPAAASTVTPPPAKPSQTASAASATALSPPAKPAVTPAVESKPVAPAAASAASGGYVLQIGAYKSQAEADASWKTFDAKHTALLSGFSSNVKQVDLGDKGVWYRLRVGGFADKDAASALCDRLKSDGGNCFLAK